MSRIIHERFDYLFPLLYIILFALTIGAIFFSSPTIGDLGVESDFYSELVVSAQKLWSGDFAVENYPFKGPVFSFALAFAHSFGGDWYTNNIILNLICASLSLLVIYRLFLRIYNRPVAVSAMILLSLHFEFFYHAHKASSDMLFFLLTFLAINLLVRKQWSAYYICAAGFIGGLAFLTRYNGFFILAAASVILIFINPGNWTRPRRVLASLIFLGAFLLPCIPWFWVNYAATGRILATRNLFNIVQEFYGGAQQEVIPRGGFGSIYHLIAYDPGYFLAHFGKNIFQHLLLDMRETLGLYLGTLFFLGSLRLFIIPPSREKRSFLIFPLFYFLFMCAVFHLPRLSLPIVPAYLAIGVSVLFGAGSADRSRLGKWLEHRFSGPLLWINQPIALKKEKPRKLSRAARRSAARRNNGRQVASVPRTALTSHSRISLILVINILIMTGLIIWELTINVSTERFYNRHKPGYILKTARFLRANKDPGSTPVIMTRKAHLAYYSGMRYQNYPQEWSSYHDLIDYALDHQVRYIVYSDIERLHFKADEFMRKMHTNTGIDVFYRDEHALVFSVAEWMYTSRVDSATNHEDLIRMIDEAERSGNPERILYTCKNIAELHLSGGDWNTGAGYYLRGMDMIRNLPDDIVNPVILADFRNHLSQVYLRQAKYREGIDLQQENIDLFTRLGDRGALARSHMLIYRHFEMLEEFDKARSHLQISSDLYLILGNRNAVRRIDRLMTRLDSRTETDPVKEIMQ